MNGATSDLLDSLPYYDNELELDPSLRQKVEQAIKRELKITEPLHPRVPPPFELFEVKYANFTSAIHHAYSITPSASFRKILSSRPS